MTSPTFDSDGYPTNETLEAIRLWPHPFTGLLEFAEEAWHENGVIRVREDEAEFVTGGWSGNEAVISKLGQNEIFFSLYWQSSHRGGKFVFKIPPE